MFGSEAAGRRAELMMFATYGRGNGLSGRGRHGRHNNGAGAGFAGIISRHPSTPAVDDATTSPCGSGTCTLPTAHPPQLTSNADTHVALPYLFRMYSVRSSMPYVLAEYGLVMYGVNRGSHSTRHLYLLNTCSLPCISVLRTSLSCSSLHPNMYEV